MPIRSLDEVCIPGTSTDFSVHAGSLFKYSTRAGVGPERSQPVSPFCQSASQSLLGLICSSSKIGAEKL
jgi:hypothetical protein